MSSAPGAPPQIIRRNDGVIPPIATAAATTTATTLASAPPSLPESNSNLSESGGGASSRVVSTVPSHDTSSHSGSSEKGVERMNPFEQQMLNTATTTNTTTTTNSNNNQNATATARGPLEPIGSHTSTSPERAATNNTNAPPPSSPATVNNNNNNTNNNSNTRTPRSPGIPAVMPPPTDVHVTAGAPQMPSHLPLHPTMTTATMTNTNSEEDDFTHSSSAVNSTEPASSYTPSTTGSHNGGSGSGNAPPHGNNNNNNTTNRHSASATTTASGMAGSLARFLENTRKRIHMVPGSGTGSGVPPPPPRRRSSDEDLIEDLDGMIISGYLQKLGRNGKWQTRWFESDGECLSYYKNENRTKLLATLDLEKVGTIGMDPADDNECSFTIQVLGRLYHLRAENKVSCTDWVITLNRIKEARMHQGNVKLVGYHSQQQQQASPVDLLDQPESMIAPQIVVVSNRQRTRAMAETQDFDQLYRDNGATSNELQGMGGASSKRLSTIGTVVLGRWNKRRSSLSRLRSKLTKWARSLRNLSCASESSIGLDNHVHPPGHDYDAAASRNKTKHLSWIGKETTAASPDAAVGNNSHNKQPPRKMSSTSEEIRVLS